MRQRSVGPGKITKEEVAVRRTVTLSGRTAPHRKVALKVGGRQVLLRSFSIESRCRDGSTLIDAESGFEPSALRAGRFEDVQSGSTDTVHFAGKVKGAEATGTLEVTDKVGKVDCSSPKVRFTAQGS